MNCRPTVATETNAYYFFTTMKLNFCPFTIYLWDLTQGLKLCRTFLVLLGGRLTSGRRKLGSSPQHLDNKILTLQTESQSPVVCSLENQKCFQNHIWRTLKLVIKFYTIDPIWYINQDLLPDPEVWTPAVIY